MIKMLNLLFLPYGAPPAGCQALLQGKPQSPVPLALEEGSAAAQEPAELFPSCAAGSLSPSHTTGAVAPPTGAHRHCNTTPKYCNVRVKLCKAVVLTGVIRLMQQSVASEAHLSLF